jgi:hypothetical protein
MLRIRSHCVSFDNADDEIFMLEKVGKIVARVHAVRERFTRRWKVQKNSFKKHSMMIFA